jgi:hypothetical protein
MSINEPRPETLKIWHEDGEVFHKIPDRAIIKCGTLFWSNDRSDLDQDIVAYEFDDGTWLDVGWYPTHDPDGYFVVHVVGPDQDFGDDTAKLLTNSPGEVARFISDFDLTKYNDSRQTTP